MHDLGKLLLFAGVALIVMGALFLVGGRFGLGQLPGDFAFRRGNAHFYFPLATSLLLSLVLTLLLWFFQKR